MDELGARLAQPREIRDDGLVRLDHLTAATEAASGETTSGTAVLALLRRKGHGQVGTDAREGIECFCLRSIEPTRERRHRYDERNADRQPEDSEDRAGLPQYELAAQVAEKEHRMRIRTRTRESALRGA